MTNVKAYNAGLAARGAVNSGVKATGAGVAAGAKFAGKAVLAAGEAAGSFLAAFVTNKTPASEKAPTVTLTEQQLREIVEAEVAAVVAASKQRARKPAATKTVARKTTRK